MDKDVIPMASVATDPYADEEVRLGRCLYEQLERLDPSYEMLQWDDLDGAQHSLYILAATTTVRLEAAAAFRILADDGVVDRRPEISE
jgi:hypothetical protein